MGQYEMSTKSINITTREKGHIFFIHYKNYKFEYKHRSSVLQN